jgi:hypothetical protein
MQFEMKRPITGGQSADPDPLADPEEVPPAALMKIPLSLRNSDTIPGGLIFTLEGTAAQTASVEVWTLDDTGEDRLASMPDIPTDAEKLAREFYLATAAAIVVTVDELTKLPATDVMPGPGTIYIRLTAVPAADAVLKVAAVN